MNINPIVKWQKNGVLTTITCPVCSNNMKNYKKPRTLDEILWGGNRCANCDAKVDKWGNLR